MLITALGSFIPVLTKREAHSIRFSTTPIKTKCVYLGCKSPTLVTSAANTEATRCEKVHSLRFRRQARCKRTPQLFHDTMSKR